MAKKNKSSKTTEKSSNTRTYVIGAMAAVLIVAVILILALSGKKEIQQEEETPQVEETPEPSLQEILTAKYDLSAYTDNLASYVGKEATLSGYLKWEEVENENDAIINKYYLIDDYGNKVTLAFAGLNSDFSQFAPLFVKGETTAQAYTVTGTFRKTFDNIRLEVSSIEEK